MTIENNMQSIGKRYSTRQEYEIGVDNNGVIQYLNSKHWGNCGSSFNEPQAAAVVFYIQKYKKYSNRTYINRNISNL